MDLSEGSSEENIAPLTKWREREREMCVEDNHIQARDTFFI